MDLKILLPAVAGVPAPLDPDAATSAGRRRPGRKEQVDPGLIPLLRNQPAQSGMEDDDDQLSAARGILLAVTFGVSFWGATVMGVMAAMR